MSNYHQNYSPAPAQQNAMQSRKPKFSAMIQTPAYQKSLQNSLSNPKEIQKFTAAITSVVSTNPLIEECDASTILSAALCGHALGLAPSPQLGQYYLVPFNDRKNDRKVATFVLGYRGYIQLAIRSGQYKKLIVTEIKEGELISWDPLTEDIEIKPILDEERRKVTETIGYYAMFRYINGFEKVIYWPKEKMKAHALQYSPGYANDVKRGWSNTFWSKDFDAMAKKTMIRQLISKWGVMSVEMQQAYVADTHVLNDDGTPDYSGDYVEAGDYTDGSSQQHNVEPAPPEYHNEVANYGEPPAAFSLYDLVE